MAPVLVQHNAKQNASSNPALGATPTDGNLLVGLISSTSLLASTTISAGWAVAASDDDDGGSFSAQIIYKIAHGDTTTPLTVTAGTTASVELAEFSGVSAIVDVAPAASDPSGISTTVTCTATGTLATTSDLVVAIASLSGTNGGSQTVDSGFTLLDTVTLTRPLAAYKIKTDSTSEAPIFTWLTTRGRQALIVAFLPGQTVQPSTVAAVAAVGSPTLTASALVTAATVSAIASIPAPTVVTSATVTPSTVTAVATVPAPSPTASALTTPATVAAVAGVGSPTITTSSGAAVTPATVTATATVPSPQLLATATIGAAAVAAIANIPVPSLLVSSLAAPATVAAIASVPSPLVFSPVYIRYFDSGPGVTRHDGTGTRTNHDGQLVGVGAREGVGP